MVSLALQVRATTVTTRHVHRTLKVAGKVWWCDNCGYEAHRRGRCRGCGERRLPSPLPELETSPLEEEVGYGIAGWDNAARGRLIEALLDATIRHRIEDGELIVRATDEAKVDELISQIVERKIWWCRSCGYEFGSSGPCEECGNELVASPLPELAPTNNELTYTVSAWDNWMRVRLIEALINAEVAHRFEGSADELVVRAEDGPIATQLTEDVVHEANNERPARRFKDVSPPSPDMAAPEGIQGLGEDFPPRHRWDSLPDRWASWRYEQLTRPGEHSSTPRDRSVGAAIVLTLLFGPLGLWYLAGRYAVVGTVAGVLLVNANEANSWTGAWPGALLLYWIGCVIFAAVNATRRHSEFQAWVSGHDSRSNF